MLENKLEYMDFLYRDPFLWDATTMRLVPRPPAAVPGPL
jgi:hypothetical protein